MKTCEGLKNQEDQTMEDTDSKKLPTPLPHICNICSKGFTEECDLTAHMSCHKKTPFKCDECGKA